MSYYLSISSVLLTFLFVLNLNDYILTALCLATFLPSGINPNTHNSRGNSDYLANRSMARFCEFTPH